ncbi:MAG: tyrosine-type recombinase/integrase [Candidatus Nealsonbacteria bacterium]|nr:tyrosine-type recombinase/integrase [Candidatus Nealsonbacteria bacterium]
MPKKDLPEGLAKRGGTYHADFSVGGKRIRKSLSRNLKTAKQLLIELRARAERGEFSLLDNNYLVADLEKQYLRSCQQALKPDTVDRYTHSLRSALAAMPTRVSQITIAAILDYREQRLADGIAPGTINKDVKVTKGMFAWGVKAGLIKDNPLHGVRKLPDDNPKEGRPLSPDEVDRLLEASPPLYRDIWYCFVVTGMRKSELASLQFDDVDWEAREVLVRRSVSKTHTARRIPIDDHLWKILQGQRDGRDKREASERAGEQGRAFRRRFTRDRVFVTRHNTPLDMRSLLYSQLMLHCKQAGIETRHLGPDGHEVDHVDVHSLRRTFATGLIVNGADPKTVMELMGHRTLEMTMNLYAKVYTGTKREALGRLPWGSGSKAPEYLLQLPQQSPAGHKTVTTLAAPAVAAT